MKIKDEPLLDLFRAAGPCERCQRPQPRREPHHVRAKGMGGGSCLDVRINLIALCTACHGLIQGSKRHEPRVLEIIALREGTTPQAIREEIDRLLRLPKGYKLDREKDVAPRVPGAPPGLYLAIGDRFYRVQPLEAIRPVLRAWKLTKGDGTAYELHADQHGLSCTCGDFTFRHQNDGQLCKHLESLVRATLLPGRAG